MFNWLKSKPEFLEVDLHSHLIPGIDDGVKSWNESISILSKLSILGFKKIITTPHIIHDYYPNTPHDIRAGVDQLNKLLIENQIELTIEAGAEYFVDEHFANHVENQEELLTFGGGYILIETPFMNKPHFLEEVVFKLRAQGIKPILAHPERYTYLQNNWQLMSDLFALGLLMQINISSLTGYYSKEAKKLAKKLIEYEKVHFLATDIHNQKHLEQVQLAMKTKLFQKCRQLKLLNSTL